MSGARLAQVERNLVAVMELVRGRPMDVEIFAGEPTVQRCRELVGEACPEVLLAGGGADLSSIGYELARGGTTWVRLRPNGTAAGTPASALGAIIGAARHASGLACFVPSAPPDVRL